MTRDELKTKCLALAAAGDATSKATLELFADWEGVCNEHLPPKLRTFVNLASDREEKSPEGVAAAATRLANGIPDVSDPSVTAINSSKPAGHYDKASKMGDAAGNKE